MSEKLAGMNLKGHEGQVAELQKQLSELQTETQPTPEQVKNAKEIIANVTKIIVNRNERNKKNDFQEETRVSTGWLSLDDKQERASGGRIIEGGKQFSVELLDVSPEINGAVTLLEETYEDGQFSSTTNAAGRRTRKKVVNVFGTGIVTYGSNIVEPELISGKVGYDRDDYEDIHRFVTLSPDGGVPLRSQDVEFAHEVIEHFATAQTDSKY